jgi:hypothetical protein
VEAEHWARWHAAYDDPTSSLSRRLVIVQRRLRDALAEAPPGPVRLASMCAGQARDVIGALTGHPRRADVRGILVEQDPVLVAVERELACAAGLPGIEAVEGDASWKSAYAPVSPVDVLLVCGVFGNISDDDIHATIFELPSLLARGASVLWTRHRMPPDLTPVIEDWFADAGFEEVAFDAEEGYAFGVGTMRFAGVPRPFGGDRRMFTFFGDGAAAHR